MTDTQNTIKITTSAKIYDNLIALTEQNLHTYLSGIPELAKSEQSEEEIKSHVEETKILLEQFLDLRMGYLDDAICLTTLTIELTYLTLQAQCYDTVRQSATKTFRQHVVTSRKQPGEHIKDYCLEIYRAWIIETLLPSQDKSFGFIKWCELHGIPSILIPDV